MILNAIAAKLKRQDTDDSKGRYFEVGLIVQAVSWFLRYLLPIEGIVIAKAEMDAENFAKHVSVDAGIIRRTIEERVTARQEPTKAARAYRRAGGRLRRR